jgi:hypothetical protein
VAGANVTFTATVQVGGMTVGTARGTMIFKVGAVVLSTNAVSGGVANFSTSALESGSHSLKAEYSGYGPFLASTSAPLAQTVKLPIPNKPVELRWAVSGNSLTLSWPADYLGRI